MRLISLNLWGGRTFELERDFVRKVAPDTDIFCFQEVVSGPSPRKNVGGSRENLYEEMQAALPDFTGQRHLAPLSATFEWYLPENGARFCQALFVRKEINVLEASGFYAYPDDSQVVRPEDRLTGNFQFVRIKSGEKEYLVGNLHGIWQRSGKSDSPERTEQFRRMREFYEKENGARILCGDFNVRPEVEGLKLLQPVLRNLNEEFGITNTRNSLYKDADKYQDYVADYVFVSPEVKVLGFRVLPDEVSDHAPLRVEFE